MGVCWGFVEGLLGVCWGFVGGLLGVCWGFVVGLLGVCWGFVGGLLGVYWRKLLFGGECVLLFELILFLFLFGILNVEIRLIGYCSKGGGVVVGAGLRKR